MRLPAVFGQRSPSLIYDTGTDVPPHALFLDHQDESGEVVSVEVFPRADGSTHITALSDVVPLPTDPAAVKPDSEAIGRLQAIAERLSPVFRPERILARQACFRPVTQDGLPLIGKVPQDTRGPGKQRDLPVREVDRAVSSPVSTTGTSGEALGRSARSRPRR